MSIRALVMLTQLEQSVGRAKAFLHDSLVAKVPFLAEFLSSVLDLLVGPLTGNRTAHYWVGVLVALLLAGLLFVAQFRHQPGFGLRGFLGYCFPRYLLTHPSTATDIKLMVANNFIMPMVNVTWRLKTAFFTGILLNGLVAIFGPPLHVFEWNIGAVIVFTILLAFAEDLGFYLCHLAHHKIPALWAFHKVHHSADVLTPLTATRNHPVEFMLIPPCKALAGSLVMAPALFLFDQPPTVLEIFGVSVLTMFFAMLGDQLFHSHIWLTWSPALQRVFVCPAQHQIHHSSAVRHHDKNMAAFFSLWDWVFGTLYIAPKQREDFAYGVHGDAKQRHPGLLTAYALPFWDALPQRATVLRWLPARLVGGLRGLVQSAQQAVAARSVRRHADTL
ncbi:sterol desaturase family protein [Roseomonas sp. BN140053]|uniref:sterol desaturase family protein n=1 Tax=Roseomonas sp. BN140053 TaxID=3391898 RepID=UPI0039E76372